MVRMLKWIAPSVAALGLMLGVASQSRAAADAVAPAAGGTVTGTVVDKDGKAASGIEVRIVKPMAHEGGRKNVPAACGNCVSPFSSRLAAWADGARGF